MDIRQPSLQALHAALLLSCKKILKTGMRNWGSFGRFQFLFRVKCSGCSSQNVPIPASDITLFTSYGQKSLNLCLFRSRRRLTFDGSSSGSEQNDSSAPFCNPFEKSPVELKEVKVSQTVIRRSKRVSGKLSRPDGYKNKNGKALWNQQRRTLWNIERVLGVLETG